MPAVLVMQERPMSGAHFLTESTQDGGSENDSQATSF
jgi:hypothetical protein